MSVTGLTYREFNQIIDQFDQKYCGAAPKTAKDWCDGRIGSNQFMRFLATTDRFARVVNDNTIYDPLPPEVVAHIARSSIGCVADLFMFYRTSPALKGRATDIQRADSLVNEAAKDFLDRLGVVVDYPGIELAYFKHLMSCVMFNYLGADLSVEGYPISLNDPGKLISRISKVERTIWEDPSVKKVDAAYQSLPYQLASNFTRWVKIKTLVTSWKIRAVVGPLLGNRVFLIFIEVLLIGSLSVIPVISNRLFFLFFFDITTVIGRVFARSLKQSLGRSIPSHLAWNAIGFSFLRSAGAWSVWMLGMLLRDRHVIGQNREGWVMGVLVVSQPWFSICVVTHLIYEEKIMPLLIRTSQLMIQSQQQEKKTYFQGKWPRLLQKWHQLTLHPELAPIPV